MNRPFYWRCRQAWYVKAENRNGRMSAQRLAKDREEAFSVWRSQYAPSPNVSPVKESPKPSPRSLRIATTKRPTTDAGQALPIDRSIDGDRGAAIERLLLVAELISPLRHGVRLDELAGDVCDLLGRNYNQRTIHRDCLLLERLGIIEAFFRPGDQNERGRPITRYRWRDGHTRSMIVAAMAERASSRREAS